MQIYGWYVVILLFHLLADGEFRSSCRLCAKCGSSRTLLGCRDIVVPRNGGRGSEPRGRAGALLMKIEGGTIDKQLFDPPHQSIIGLRHIKGNATRLRPGKTKMIGKILFNQVNIPYR